MVKFLYCILIVVTLGIGCKKKDDKNDYLLLGFLYNYFEKNKSSCKAGICFTFAQTVSPSSRNSLSLAVNSGDGAGDGFTDVFLTPSVMGLGICEILGYRPVGNGGPASGTETAINGTPLLKITGSIGNVCSSYMIVAIKEGTLPGLNMSITELGNTYDRIGIVLNSVNAYFGEIDIPDPNRRYWSAIYSNPQAGSSLRGFVFNTVPNDKCNDDAVNNGNLVDPLPNTDFGAGCAMGIIPISTNGGEQAGSTFPLNTGTPKYPFQHAGASLIQGDPNSLKFKQPDDMARFSSSEAFVVVLPITTSDVATGLVVNVYKDNLLFYDTNDGDTKYDPVFSIGDRPTATDGDLNLSDSSLKNLIFNAPTFEVRK